MTLRKSCIISFGLHCIILIILLGMSVLKEKVIIDFDVRQGISSLRIHGVENKREYNANKSADGIRQADVTDLLVTIAAEGAHIQTVKEKHDLRSVIHKQASREVVGALSKMALENSQNFPPQYPHLAKKLYYQGNVLLSIEVLPNGTVGEVGIISSSGYSVLDDAAINAAKKWLFLKNNEFTIAKPVLISWKIAFRIE